MTRPGQGTKLRLLSGCGAAHLWQVCTRPNVVVAQERDLKAEVTESADGYSDRIFSITFVSRGCLELRTSWRLKAVLGQHSWPRAPLTCSLARHLNWNIVYRNKKSMSLQCCLAPEYCHHAHVQRQAVGLPIVTEAQRAWDN